MIYLGGPVITDTFLNRISALIILKHIIVNTMFRTKIVVTNIAPLYLWSLGYYFPVWSGTMPGYEKIISTLYILLCL